MQRWLRLRQRIPRKFVNIPTSRTKLRSNLNWSLRGLCTGILGGGGVHAWGGGMCARGDMGAWVGGRVCHARPPVDRLTDACENITLLQTSFAGGKNINFNIWRIIEHFSLAQSLAQIKPWAAIEKH